MERRQFLINFYMYSAHFSTIYVPGMSYMQKEKLLFPHSVATDFTFSTKKLSSFFLFFRWYCLNYEKSFCGNEEKKLLNVLFPLLHFFLPLLSFSIVPSIRQYSNSFIYFLLFFLSLYILLHLHSIISISFIVITFFATVS